MLIELVQVGPDRMVQRAVLDVELLRLRGPRQNLLNRSHLVADLVVLLDTDSIRLVQAGAAWQVSHSRRRSARGVWAFKEAIEQVGITGHRQVQVIANLAGQSRRLLDEVAAMPCPQLQLAIGWLQLELAQSEAGDGRSVLRVQVRFRRSCCPDRPASDTAWWRTDERRVYRILPRRMHVSEAGSSCPFAPRRRSCPECRCCCWAWRICSIANLKEGA